MSSPRHSARGAGNHSYSSHSMTALHLSPRGGATGSVGEGVLRKKQVSKNLPSAALRHTAASAKKVVYASELLDESPGGRNLLISHEGGLHSGRSSHHT